MATHWRHLQSLTDAQISLLENLGAASNDPRITQLNRKRNSLGPMNRLSPEVLSRILLASLTTSNLPCSLPNTNPDGRICLDSPLEPRTNPFKVWQKGGIPEGLTLCHISHYWRAVALGTPSLWSHIQITQTTNPELLAFVRTNAKRTLLDLDIYLIDIDWRRLQTRDHLVEMLFSGVNQVRSLALCCESEKLFRQLHAALVRKKSPIAENLQSLEIVVCGFPQMVHLFPSGTPRLRSLDVQGITIPWDSRMLKSDLLTHLVLRATQSFDHSAFAKFSNFLRRENKLKSLSLDFPYQPSLDWTKIGGKPSHPIELPYVETLRLVSALFYRPIDIFMDSVRLHVAQSVSVTCWDDETDMQAICSFSNPGVPYERMEVSYEHEPSGRMSGFVFSFGCLRRDFNDEVNVDHPMERASVMINTGDNISSQLVDSGFPSSLRIISLGVLPTVAIPQQFWTVLGSLPGLEVVSMERGNMWLVGGLLRAMGSGEDCTPFDDDARRPSSFPALQAIFLKSLELVMGDQELDLPGQWGRPPFQPPSALYPYAPPISSFIHLVQQYFKLLISQLEPWNVLHRRRLKVLHFSWHGTLCDNGQDCGHMLVDSGLADLGDELVGRLLEVSDRVQLDGRSYSRASHREDSPSRPGSVREASPNFGSRMEM